MSLQPIACKGQWISCSERLPKRATLPGLVLAVCAALLPLWGCVSRAPVFPSETVSEQAPTIGTPEVREFAPANVLGSDRLNVVFRDGAIISYSEFAEPDIDYVAAFWQATYIEHVQPRILAAVPLQKMDLCILSCHLESLLACINAHAGALLLDMQGLKRTDFPASTLSDQPEDTPKPEDSEGPSSVDEKSDALLAGMLRDATERYLFDSQSQARQRIRDFGSSYQQIPREVITEELQLISADRCKGMAKKQLRVRLGDPRNTHDIVCMGLFWALGGWQSAVAGLPVYQYKRLNKRALRPYAALDLDHRSREISRCWVSAATDCTETWNKTMEQVLSALEGYLLASGHPDSLNACREELTDVKNRWRQVKFQQHAVFYDLPLVLGYKAALQKAYAAKGLLNDDEDEMVTAGILLNDYAGTMHGKVVSPYTAIVYTELTKFLKDELSVAEYKEMEDTAKLFATELELLKL